MNRGKGPWISATRLLCVLYGISCPQIRPHTAKDIGQSQIPLSCEIACSKRTLEAGIAVDCHFTIHRHLPQLSREFPYIDMVGFRDHAILPHICNITYVQEEEVTIFTLSRKVMHTPALELA